jgi:hypothetical protein
MSYLEGKKMKIKNYFGIIIICMLFNFVLNSNAFGQENLAQNKEAAKKIEKQLPVTDTSKINTPSQNSTNDVFIDKDGDGINDNRCGRGMGLQKNNRQHQCIPNSNCMPSGQGKQMRHGKRGPKK